MGVLYHKVHIYKDGNHDTEKEFLTTDLTIDDVYKSLMDKANLYTLKHLNLIPVQIADLITYTPGSMAIVNTGKLHKINKNLYGLTPDAILRLLKLSKHDITTLAVYKLTVNSTETLYSITEEYITYTGLKKGEKLRTKKKVINYVSVSREKMDVLYFDKNDEVTRDIYEYFKEKYKLKSKKEFLMVLFEKNGKLPAVTFTWKLNITGDGKKVSRRIDEKYIWFED